MSAEESKSSSHVVLIHKTPIATVYTLPTTPTLGEAPLLSQSRSRWPHLGAEGEVPTPFLKSPPDRGRDHRRLQTRGRAFPRVLLGLELSCDAGQGGGERESVCACACVSVSVSV